MNEITLMPSGKKFGARPSQTVLEAAIDAGINIPYGCRNGACGACKAKVLAGQVVHGDYQRTAMSDAELSAGQALLCCAYAQGNVEVECRDAIEAAIRPRILPARVAKKTLLAHDVMAIHLQLPASERLQFQAGQYLEFILKDGKRRAFSIANAPHDDACLELHIRLIAGGEFTQYVFNEMPEKTILRLEAPLGSFFLREASSKPIIFVAGGTGFAPIKGIIEHMIHSANARPILLYRGAKTLADLYMDELCQRWAAHLPNLSYIPVLSEAKPEDAWLGRTGLVHQVVLTDIADLSGYQAYVCGAPAMCDAACKDFTARGLRSDDFFSDAFTFATGVSAAQS